MSKFLVFAAKVMVLVALAIIAMVALSTGNKLMESPSSYPIGILWIILGGASLIVSFGFINIFILPSEDKKSRLDK